jgi:hypothetical protein
MRTLRLLPIRPGEGVAVKSSRACTEANGVNPPTKAGIGVNGARNGALAAALDAVERAAPSPSLERRANRAAAAASPLRSRSAS